MAIESHCSGCGALLRVGDEHAGRPARCPQCGGLYTVPVSGQVSGGEQEYAQQGSAPDPEVRHAGAPDVADEWYLRSSGGQVFGPEPRPTLDRWMAEGRVGRKTQIRHGADGAWQPADRFFPEVSDDAAKEGDAPAREGSPFTSDAGVTVGRSRPALTQQPHRGGLILGLAIAAFVVSCPLLSVVAWIMGNGDVRKMRAGHMDASGLGITEAGRILGMILSLLWIVVFAVAAFMMLFLLAAHA